MAHDHSNVDKQAIGEFLHLVNMPPNHLEHWLESGEITKVGRGKDGASESTGRLLGHEIVELLHAKKSDYTDEDVDRMRKVTGYIKRHTA